MFIDINASNTKYYSPMRLVSKLISDITTFIGIILSFKLRIDVTNFISLYYFANIGLFSIFFISSRYS